MPDNNIKISIHDGTVNVVDDSTKSAVYKAVKKINSTFSPEVFNNINLHITSDFSNLPKSGSSFSNYLKENEAIYQATKGITLDDFERKEIIIQESAFWGDKFLNIFSKFSFSANDEIEQATLHEFGHQLNFIGGDPNLIQKYQKIVNKYNDVQSEEVEILPEEEKILEEYHKNNEFSDKDDFKKALKKDLQNLKKGSILSKLNRYYFEFYFYAKERDCTMPNFDDIEKANDTRSEIFAQSFSYIMGSDDGNKEEFIKTFPNTYKIVEKYVNTVKL